VIGEIVTSLCILAASCYLYYEATALRQFRAYKEVGPDFWPKIVLLLLIVLSLALTVLNTIKWKRARGEVHEHEEGWKRVVTVIILSLAYIYFLKPLGFIVATPFFILGMMLLIMPKRRKAIPFTILGIMLMIYIIFGKLLYVPLPKGFGIFHDLSILLGL
jgi:uncharacterized membrane protein YidH (DUF202 family)